MTYAIPSLMRESLDGWFEVGEIDHDGGLVLYMIVDRDEGSEYVARYEDGWRVAPNGHTTVDMERLIGDSVQAFDPDFEGVVGTLNLISGKAV